MRVFPLAVVLATSFSWLLLLLLPPPSSALFSKPSWPGRVVGAVVQSTTDPRLATPIITARRASENDVVDPTPSQSRPMTDRNLLSLRNESFFDDDDDVDAVTSPPSSAPPSSPVVSDLAAILLTSAASMLATLALSSLGGVVVVPSSSLGATLHRIQRFGENLLAGMLAVAFLQGGVALLQYRTNPSGQLVVPPGLTAGVARPPAAAVVDPASTAAAEESVAATPAAAGTAAVVSSSSPPPLPARYTQVVNITNRWLVLLVPWVGRQFSFLLARNTHLFHVVFIFTLARIFDLPHQWSSLSHGTPPDDGGAARRRLDGPGVVTTTSDVVPAFDGATGGLTSLPPIGRLIVLGDSLAVGLGCVDTFDVNRNSSLPFERIENLGGISEESYHHSLAPTSSLSSSPSSSSLNSGPVFPRVLAETLAKQGGRDVYWRSAGVDGGATYHVEEYCLGVVEEEVRRGRPPDLVVLLCGVNDLKYYLSSNPLSKGRTTGPRAFRRNLRRLVDSVHRLAPDCTIVLPSVPSQMFHRNSPINIFPLNFVMDGVIGFWDSLTAAVAQESNNDRASSDESSGGSGGRHPNKGRVLYLRTNPKEVMQWYKEPSPLRGMQPADPWSKLDPLISDLDEGLISADGVHPNAKCYALWAQSLAKRLMPYPSMPSRQQEEVGEA